MVLNNIFDQRLGAQQTLVQVCFFHVFRMKNVKKEETMKNDTK